MSKSALRKKYKALRNELTAEQLDDFSIAIANRLLKLPIWEKRYYHLFLTIAEQKEIDTEFILNILAGKDKDIILSKSNFEDHSLTHFLLTDNTILKKNLPTRLMWFLCLCWLMIQKEIELDMEKGFTTGF